jgi:hypothetical protein
MGTAQFPSTGGRCLVSKNRRDDGGATCRLLTAASGDLHQRRRMRHPSVNRDPANRRQEIESVLSQ